MDTEEVTVAETLGLERVKYIDGGSFGKVYKGYDHQSGNVAVKKINLSSRSVKGRPHEEEISLLLKVSHHSNIVQLLWYEVKPESIFLVMEYCEGGNLTQRINKCRRDYGYGHVPEVLIWSWTLQIINAVEFTHRNKIIHRDIKPDNILFKRASDNHLKLCDYGIARSYDVGGRGYAETSCTTQAFASPEILVFAPKYNEKNDIWMIGATVFSMLIRYPRQGKPYISQIRKEKPDCLFKDDTLYSHEIMLLCERFLKIDPTCRPDLASIMADYAVHSIAETLLQLDESVLRENLLGECVEGRTEYLPRERIRDLIKKLKEEWNWHFKGEPSEQTLESDGSTCRSQLDIYSEQMRELCSTNDDSTTTKQQSDRSHSTKRSSKTESMSHQRSKPRDKLSTDSGFGYGESEEACLTDPSQKTKNRHAQMNSTALSVDSGMESRRRRDDRMYLIRITTSSHHKDSQADTTVYVNICGDNRDTGKIHLRTSKNNGTKVFRRGKIDEFVVESPAVGEITSLQFWLADPKKSWRPSEILVMEYHILNASSELPLSTYLCGGKEVVSQTKATTFHAARA